MKQVDRAWALAVAVLLNYLNSLTRLKEIKLETLQSSASERPRYMPKAAAIHYLKEVIGYTAAILYTNVAI